MLHCNMRYGMKKIVKKYFIPHAGNNYHPHILHAKRALFYSALFVSMKLIAVLVVLSLPLRVFVMPDVLAQEQKQIVALTNVMRTDLGVNELIVRPMLEKSAQAKADDMVVNEYFSHTSPEGLTVREFLRQAGYRYSTAGENLAMGFSTAEQVIEAWKNSPTHYANLIDKDFIDLGVGLSGGVYAGEPVVYVAQHFASPSALTAVTVATKNNTAVATTQTATVKPTTTAMLMKESDQVATMTTTDILSAKESVPSETALENIFFFPDESKVYWREENNQTVFSVRAKIIGPVQEASVFINDKQIELLSDSESFYRGELTVVGLADDFFRVIVPPVVKITARSGETINETIDWYNVKTVSPSPIEQYVRAESTLSGWTKIFDIIKGVYWIFLMIFSLSLLLSVFIEIKKQHPHVIVQTLGLIGLLACLITL